MYRFMPVANGEPFNDLTTRVLQLAQSAKQMYI